MVAARSRLLFLALALMAGVVMSSCSHQPSRVPVYPVTGQVFFQKKPAEGAVVVLAPVQDDPERRVPRPFGTVDREGNFKLTTYDPDDGAPTGDFVVLVTWRKRANADEDDEQETDDLLGGRYAAPNASPLRVHVPQGGAILQPFNLQ